MSEGKSVVIIGSSTLVKDDTCVLWATSAKNAIDEIKLHIKEKTHPLYANAFVMHEIKDPKVNISELDLPIVPGSPGTWVKMPLDKLLVAIAAGKPNATIQVNCQCVELIKKIGEVYKKPIMDEFNLLVQIMLSAEVSHHILRDTATTSEIFDKEIIPQIFTDVNKLHSRKLQPQMYAKKLFMMRLSRNLGLDSI